MSEQKTEKVMKRLVIQPIPKWGGEAPMEDGRPPLKYEAMDLGVGSLPRFIVVVRGEPRRDVVNSAMVIGVDGNNLGGSPIVWLPEGADIAVFSVEP